MMTTFRVVLFVIGVLAAANFFVSLLFSWHFGSVLLGLFAADLIACAIFFEKLPKWVRGAILGVYCVPIVFAAFLAGYGNTRRPPSIDCPCCEYVVIVLGAGLRDGEPGGHLARRLDTAAEFLHIHHVPVVVTGGLGAGQAITEAAAMAAYLERAGIAAERILLEDASTSTYENLKFAARILRERERSYSDLLMMPTNDVHVIVTNDFHIFRATRQARALGLPAYGLPAPTPWHSLAPNYLREMAAVVNYWVSTI
ncbi:MAG: YdcF family protein [Defluviitaleaceae bacterium]|nr:YdcF family protein [Defluviitaleaceae bacterium]